MRPGVRWLPEPDSARPPHFDEPARKTFLNANCTSSSATTLRYAWYDSPIGPLMVARDEIAVRHLTIPDRDPSRPDSPRVGATKTVEPGPGWVRDDAGLRRELAELEAYFAGELREFEMAVEPEGTAFRRKVWAELARIPYGETWSYGELARRATGRTGAARAVGAANGANPIAIVLPCHRVVGAGGSLVGYGGGLTRKALLLAHERGEGVPWSCGEMSDTKGRPPDELAGAGLDIARRRFEVSS